MESDREEWALRVKAAEIRAWLGRVSLQHHKEQAWHVWYVYAIPILGSRSQAKKFLRTFLGMKK